MGRKVFPTTSTTTATTTTYYYYYYYCISMSLYKFCRMCCGNKKKLSETLVYRNDNENFIIWRLYGIYDTILHHPHSWLFVHEAVESLTYNSLSPTHSADNIIRIRGNIYRNEFCSPDIHSASLILLLGRHITPGIRGCHKSLTLQLWDLLRNSCKSSVIFCWYLTFNNTWNTIP